MGNLTSGFKIGRRDGDFKTQSLYSHKGGLSMARFNCPVIDYSNEQSSASFPVADGVLDAALTSLFGALDGVIIGNLGQSTLNIATTKDNGGGGIPADAFAQREIKWLCRYTNNVTGKIRRLELPCADANLLAGNTDFLDLTAGAGLTFKTEFEASVQDPDTGDAVTLNTVQLVGRSL